ncbi:response regulator transcription factor [Brachybacterium alimentarium]|uniref:DNA-binding response regulator n=1 Tax=Brevibacterium aurantiacum TaxID=273384 RepID=A0A4Z0KHF0_BREAU|nr:response regulator transcription factor [Brevibacterium aurantiacum]TGD36706.1 DNA-binding response regulator [Brevibacterium aurantiacum]
MPEHRTELPTSSTTPELIRVILAEDITLIREGLQLLLERNGFDVVAAVGSAEELLEHGRLLNPDLVVTDVRMPPTFRSEGLAAAVALRVENPALPVVVLSQYVEQSYVAELLDSTDGAGVGYLLKDRVSDVAEFADTLRRVHAGGTAVDPAVVNQLIQRRRDPLESLTPREREVLAVMAEGHSNAAIARRLVISEAAVVKHIGSILMKLDLPQNDDQNRRVTAVLTYLRGREA